MTEYGYAIKFEGWGDRSASVAADQLFRICTRAPDTDPDSLYIEALYSYPAEIGLEQTWQDRVTQGGELTFEIMSDPATMAALAPVLARYDDGDALAQLQDTVGPTATQMVFNINSISAGTVGWIGREAIEVGSLVSGAGVRHTYNVTRGLFNTRPWRHVAPDGDRQLFLNLTVLKDRIIQFVRYPLDGTYTDEEVRWTGVITRRAPAFRDMFTLTCRHLVTLVEDGEIMGAGRWQGTCEGGTFAAGGGVGSASTPQDTLRYAPMAGNTGSGVNTQEFLVSIDGKAARRAVWIDQGALSNTPVFWPTINPGTRALGLTFNPEGVERLEGVAGKSLFEIISLDDGLQPPIRTAYYPGGDTHLPTNPVELVWTILTTTPGGYNGSKDFGVGLLGLGIDTNYVDTVSFSKAVARTAGYEVKRLILGWDGQAVRVKDLFEQLLGPLHLALSVGPEGFRIAQFRDAYPLGGADWVIGLADHVSVDGNPAGIDFNDDAGVDRVKVITGTRFGGDGSEVNTNNAISQDRYGRASVDLPEYDVSAYSSPTHMASTTSLRIAQAYKRPPVVTSCRISADEFDPWPGDIADYSHPDLWAEDGTLGISGVPALVIGRRLITGDEDGYHETVDVDLALTGSVIKKQGRIAPSARVYSFTHASGTVSGNHELVVHRNYWIDAASDPLATDTAGFSAGQDVSIADRDLADRGASYNDLPLKNIRANDPSASYDTFEIGATASGITPVATDVIRFGTEASDGQPRSNYAWIGPATGGTFSTSGRALYQWVLDVTAHLGGASLTPAFRRLDDEAARAEWPLDQALALQIAWNTYALLTGRLGHGVVTFNQTNLPKLHGAPVVLGILGPWILPRDVTELTLQAGYTCVNHPVTVFATILTRDEMFGRHSAQSVLVGTGIATFTLDDLDDLEGPLVVAVCADSQVSGTPVELKGENIAALSNWALFGGVQATTTAGTVYKLVATDPGGLYENAYELPGERLLLNQVNVGGFDAETHHFWPLYDDDTLRAYNNNGPLSWDVTPIGHLNVSWIECRETATNAITEPAGSFRGGLETASRTFASIIQDLEWCSLNRLDVIGWGPGVMRQVRDTNNASIPHGFVGAGCARETTSKERWCIWSASCATPNVPYASRTDSRGDVQYLSAIRVAGLVGVYSKPSPQGASEVELELEVRIETTAGQTPRWSQSQIRVVVPINTVALSPRDVTGPLLDNPWLRIFRPYRFSARTQGRASHSADGLWPILGDDVTDRGAHRPGYGPLGLELFDLVITDESASSVPDIRKVEVFAKIVGWIDREARGHSGWELIVCPGATARILRLPLL